MRRRKKKILYTILKFHSALESAKNIGKSNTLPQMLKSRFFELQNKKVNKKVNNNNEACMEKVLKNQVNHSNWIDPSFGKI